MALAFSAPQSVASHQRFRQRDIPRPRTHQGIAHRQLGPHMAPRLGEAMRGTPRARLACIHQIDMEAGARSVADSLWLELIVQAPEREIDVEKQMQIVENLLQRKIKVLMLVPSGSKEIVPAVVKANAAKIPVVTVDTRVDAATLAAAGGSVATFIGSDNEDGGRMAGAFVVERLGAKLSTRPSHFINRFRSCWCLPATRSHSCRC